MAATDTRLGPDGPVAALWSPDKDDEPLASEDDILALVDSLFPSRTTHTPIGRGHDCVELAAADETLALSTDMFWQDAHFRTDYYTPREAGAKALTSAVSDLAAAGAVPLGFSLGLLLPPGMGRTPLAGALEGMAEKARDFGMVLTGGDLARGDKLGFSVTVWGRPLTPETAFLRRGQAEPGDYVFLVGESGLSRVGLWMLERQGRAALGQWPKSCQAHLDPRPLLREGQAVAALARVFAEENHETRPRFSLMDLSDGLARDLPRLLMGLGCHLDLEAEGIHREIHSAAKLMGLSPEALFLLGGEDYALIGTCPEACWARLRSAVPGARALGKVRAASEILWHGKPLALEGFDHFSSKGITPTEAQEAAELAQSAAAIISIGREAWQAGLMAGFNGNISCRASVVHSAADTPAHTGLPVEACLITRSGAAKSRLRTEDLALLGISGGVQIRGPLASSESPLHLRLYEACPQSRAILHTHPPRLLALSLLLPPEKRLDLPLPEAERYRALLAHTPFFPPGSDDLAAAVARAATTHNAIWMERHGLVVHGPDLTFALSLTEELEQLALVCLALMQSETGGL